MAVISQALHMYMKACDFGNTFRLAFYFWIFKLLLSVNKSQEDLKKDNKSKYPQLFIYMHKKMMSL